MKSKVDEIWANLEKNFGDDGFGNLEQLSVISSGSLTLDDAIGVWGIPRGRIIQFAGKESSGKTLMSLLAIKEWQNKAPHNWALFIDAEFTFDEKWARYLGVDTSPQRLKVLKTNNGKVIFEKLSEDGKKKGLLAQVRDMGGSDESGLGIIVLDSIAFVVPPIEDGAEVGKQNMAPQARFLPAELRKLAPLLAKTNVTFIAINQVRTNIGQMYGDPTSTPGGNAWKHACSLMVFFTTSNSKDNQVLNASGEKIGHVIMSKVDKNKVGSPHRKANFTIEYTNGVRKSDEIAELATKYGVVKRPNNKTYEYGDVKIIGKDAYYSAIKNNEISNEELLEKIKEAKLSNVVIEEPPTNETSFE
jgi:recombination protein RecA